MKKLISITLFVLLFCSAAFAQDAVVDRYSEAMKQSREDNGAKAVEILLEIVEQHPKHHIADDAMFQAGNIAEKKLGRYDQAQKLYFKVFQKYPKSKNARRARKRYKYLTMARASGDEPLRIYTKVMQELPTLGLEKGVALMTELYEKYPDFHRRDQVLYWIGENLRRLDRYDEAAAAYLSLPQKYPDSQWAYYCYEKLGQMYIELRQFDKAIQTFGMMPQYESRQRGATRSSNQLIALVKRFQRLQNLFYLALAFCIGAFALWIFGTKWKTVTRRLVIGGIIDASLSSIVVIVAIVYSLKNAPVYRNTLFYLLGIFSVSAFCNHLYVKTNNFRLVHKILLSFALFFVAASFIYVVYYQMDVVNLLYDSIMSGRKSGGGRP